MAQKRTKFSQFIQLEATTWIRVPYLQPYYHTMHRFPLVPSLTAGADSESGACFLKVTKENIRFPLADIVS